MKAPQVLRATVAAAIAVTAFFALVMQQGSASLGDLLLIASASSLMTLLLASFVRSPKQFARALFERVYYCVIVVLCVLIRLFLFALRIFLILLKLSLKFAIAAAAAIAYVVMPLDVIPDFIVGLGQIDDLLVVISLSVWAFTFGVTDEMRSAITGNRPKTPFP